MWSNLDEIPLDFIWLGAQCISMQADRPVQSQKIKIHCDSYKLNAPTDGPTRWDLAATGICPYPTDVYPFGGKLGIYLQSHEQNRGLIQPLWLKWLTCERKLEGRWRSGGVRAGNGAEQQGGCAQRSVWRFSQWSSPPGLCEIFWAFSPCELVYQVKSWLFSRLVLSRHGSMLQLL